MPWKLNPQYSQCQRKKHESWRNREELIRVFRWLHPRHAPIQTQMVPQSMRAWQPQCKTYRSLGKTLFNKYEHPEHWFTNVASMIVSATSTMVFDTAWGIPLGTCYWQGYMRINQGQVSRPKHLYICLIQRNPTLMCSPRAQAGA